MNRIRTKRKFLKIVRRMGRETEIGERQRAFRKVEPHKKLLWFPIQEELFISQSAVPHCGFPFK